MRAGVEARRLELPPDVGKRLPRCLRERESPFLQQAIDVIGTKADPFHMERRHRPLERVAFLEQSAPAVAGRLRLDVRDEVPDPGLCGRT